jgi:sulfate transport system ATP-binding protein
VFNKGRIEQVGAPDEVYDHPQTAFVNQFLGHTNRFRGELRAGVADIGGTVLDADEHKAVAHAPAVVFVRPHEMDIVASPCEASFGATLNHVVKLGPVVRLELTRHERGETVEVELPRHKLDQLDLEPGRVVYLKPRRARVFVEDANSLRDAARGWIEQREVPRIAPSPAPAAPVQEKPALRAA